MPRIIIIVFQAGKHNPNLLVTKPNLNLFTNKYCFKMVQSKRCLNISTTFRPLSRTIKGGDTFLRIIPKKSSANPHAQRENRIYKLITL